MPDREGGPDEQPCRWCGDVHGPRCPWVKALEFEPMTGSVTRVEFLTPKDWGPPPQPNPEEPDDPAADYPKRAPLRG